MDRRYRFIRNVANKPHKSEQFRYHLSGEYDRPLEVIAFDVSEGWARDVSEDIAGLVVEKARSENRTLGESARKFVESHLDEELEPELCS